jgi:hypothetical protein
MTTMNPRRAREDTTTAKNQTSHGAEKDPDPDPSPETANDASDPGHQMDQRDHDLGIVSGGDTGIGMRPETNTDPEAAPATESEKKTEIAAEPVTVAENTAPPPPPPHPTPVRRSTTNPPAN